MPLSQRRSPSRATTNFVLQRKYLTVSLNFKVLLKRCTESTFVFMIYSQGPVDKSQLRILEWFLIRHNWRWLNRIFGIVLGLVEWYISFTNSAGGRGSSLNYISPGKSLMGKPSSFYTGPNSEISCASDLWRISSPRLGDCIQSFQYQLFFNLGDFIQEWLPSRSLDHYDSSVSL